ncbi:MAG: DEAD/DEAH box helicase family protein [Actinomycetales bacterium]|nr:DEAD/DEAH box helicase family protein [Actinomycetales bacterium]
MPDRPPAVSTPPGEDLQEPSIEEARLRQWQVQALERYREEMPKDFLVTATPGAGKTTFALSLATWLRSKRAIDRVVVVVPTDHLRTQWADAAGRRGLVLDPALRNSSGPVRPDTQGYVTTYAQVAGHPMLHRARVEAKRSLVILDEIHHAGDSLSWGDAVSEAFAPAARRLCLTGTPFRTNPQERIPFIRYEETAEGDLASLADFEYGYRQALGDRVVRPVVFAAYTGTSRWVNSAGEVMSAALNDAGTKRREETAWRTALAPDGKWIPHVIAAADQRLTDLRRSGMPDAAVLMLATDQDSARAYARIVTQVTGSTPVVVVSDDPKSSKRIEAFNSGDDRWLIAVRQVSEGVDITRLAVCVWTTSYRTPLFFAQAVGRVVRARSPHETATVFLPAVRPLLALAAEMEEARNHVVRLPVGDSIDDALIERVSEPGLPEFTALDSEAEFAHVLHAGQAHTAARELDPQEEEFLGLPGLLTPEQTATLLAVRDAKLRKAVPMTIFDELEAVDDGGMWRDIEALRREVHAMVGQLAARTSREHAQVHVELRRAVPGPPSASAPLEILLARRDYLLGKVG